MQAMRAGVREFLAHPVDTISLEAALKRIADEQAPGEKSLDRKLIVVMGAKGGVGSTTVAVNLGAQLARTTQQRVILIDLARPMGHVSLLLDLRSRFSFRDATGNLERLDSHFFNALLTVHEKSGLEVLAGATDPDVAKRSGLLIDNDIKLRAVFLTDSSRNIKPIFWSLFFST